MKTVRIQTQEIGLLFKNGDFHKVLAPGKHWIWPNETLYFFKRGELLKNPPRELTILLSYPEIAAELDVLEVKDNEIALQYENERFQNILTKGRWAYWKGVKEYTYQVLDITQLTIPAEVDLASLMPTVLGTYTRTITVEQYEKAILYIDWKFDSVLGPGTYYWWKNNTPINFAKIDTRRQQMEISGQEILTKDKASIRISFYVQYQVKDVIKALVENKEYDKQLYVQMQLALRAYIGGLTLDELLDKKADMAEAILQATAAKAGQLGIELSGGGVRDIILPGDMRDIMNQVLMAEKKAQANIIMRREETASTRSLLNTAKLMEDNEMLWKLKEMEYVEKIADKINSISVSGSGQIIDQLKQIFVSSKN
jgi:regulator of protease activity HflC (stomatin/prohibitin superfamily)